MPGSSVNNSSTTPKNLVGFTLQLAASRLSLRIISVLGQGSFGTVYLAACTTAPSKYYAIKHIPTPSSFTSTQKLFQQQEIALHARVSAHSKIITLYDAVSVNYSGEEGYFMVMEYCDQPDLFDFLADGRIERYADPDAVIKELFAQICDAVEFCHKRGIYHRDIKPENIMLTTEKDGTLGVRLGDFGLACDYTCISRGCGSTTYMSPESHLDFPLGYDPAKADSWSLGVLLCHMVSGLAPWRKAEPNDPGFIYHLQNPHDGLQKLLGLPRGVTSIIKKVFVLDPSKRMSVSELRDAVLQLNKVRKVDVKQQESAKEYRNAVVIDEDGLLATATTTTTTTTTAAAAAITATAAAADELAMMGMMTTDSCPVSPTMSASECPPTPEMPATTLIMQNAKERATAAQWSFDSRIGFSTAT